MTEPHAERQDPVYVRYLDHLLFRNSNSCLYKPVVREAVGWLIKEDEEAIWILWDRSVQRIPNEKAQPKESGIIILKSDILELRRLVSQGICTSSRSSINVEYAPTEDGAKNSTKVERKKGKTMQPSQEDINEPKAQPKTTLSRRRKQEQEDI